MDKPSTSISILAGAAAGGCETIVTYPIEYLKTRLQLPTTTTPPLSSFTILRSTLSTSGLPGLYSGCAALALSNMAKSGIRFLGFETARSNLPVLFPALQNSPMLSVYAGLCAGVAESVLVVTPGEAVKTRVVDAAAASSGGKGGGRLSTAQLVRAMVRQEGVFSFWRGLAPVVCKQGTNSAVRFSTFGALKELLGKSDAIRKNASPSVVTFAAGAGSGVVTVYASMPFDNIKTRVQTGRLGGVGMLGCARGMLRDEGLRVFWKATTPRLLRLTLSSSITFTVYDYVVRMSRLSG